MTPIEILGRYIQSTGLLGAWTGPDGLEQPPVTLQMRELDESLVANDKRILLIKNVSRGGGDRYVSTPVFVFATMGKVSPDDEAFAEHYAYLIYDALLKFDHQDCIISIEPLGNVGGSYKSESGRSVYDCEFMVNVDSGIIDS